MKKVYVVGTCDTKERELQFVKSQIIAAGIPAILIDVSTKGQAGKADVPASQVAEHHPRGSDAVLGKNDRGSAVEAMSIALTQYFATRDDIAGVIGMGGGGNTALVTQAMRSLRIGLPKVMVSSIASGDVSPYVGPCDICMLYSVTDIAGINSINRIVLGNAANAIAGMAKRPMAADEQDIPAIGLTQFGVTTKCVDQVRDEFDPTEYECMVFHATGTGGQTMEKLVDSGFLVGLLDITTTEVADFLIGGNLPCTADRFGAIARTKVPCVVSCGALDMVNFGPMNTIPPKFRKRLFHKHNPYVTLMRTTPEENMEFGVWIANRLNECEGEVRLLIPESGVSGLDAPGMPFHDPTADQALFDALEMTLKQTPSRRIIRLPLHINDRKFSLALANSFKDILGGDSP